MSMKIIYQGRVWNDEDVPSLEVNDVCSVPTEELQDLLSQILSTLQSRKQLDIAEDVVTRYLKLIRPEEATAIANLKLANTDLFYTNGHSMNSLKLDEKIPEYKLNEMALPSAMFLVAVKLPENLQKQVDAYKKRQKEKEKMKELLKKQKAIAKAKKLLTSQGHSIENV